MSYEESDAGAADASEYQASDRDVQATWVYDVLVLADLSDLGIDPYSAPDAEHVAGWIRGGCSDESTWPEMSALLAGTDEEEQQPIKQRLTAALGDAGEPPASQW